MGIDSQQQPDSRKAETQTIVSMCGICPGGCGVRAHLVNGQLDRITPLEDHPRGIVCTRGVHSREIVYSPDRLKHPLKRAGAKGEGRFARISWDQALDEIAQRLKEIKARYGPELLPEFPLVFNSGARLQSAFRSQHLNIPGLLKMQPEPNVLINPQDAEARGISDGDRVYVKSLRGQVPFRAKVTEWVVPGSVEVNVGGGGPLQPEAWREANANYLTDMDNRDPISGFPVLKALLCEVQKVDIP